MDKVIIDGVDVSECEQIFKDNKCALIDQYFCENNPNCYYKQLQRLEQENEELQGKYNGLNANYNSIKFENERLKKLKFKSDGIELLQDANLNLHNANVKYRQALQEIREIATALYMNNWLQMNETAKESIKLLQAKINEVIGAEE